MKNRVIRAVILIGAIAVAVLAVESVVLSLAGGLIGILSGVVLSYGVTRLLQWPTAVTPDSILLSFGVAAATGVFFGFYPAKKAAALDPIEALRHE